MIRRSRATAVPVPADGSATASTGDLPDRVRLSCRAVASRSQHVHVEADRIPSYAEQLWSEATWCPTINAEQHFLGHGAATLAFVFALDSINFGSGYFPHMRKLPGLSGYQTMATRLTRWCESNGPPTAGTLARLTVGDCHRIFEQSADGGPIDELMGLYGQGLNELGRFVTSRFDGSFTALVESAGGKAARLVELLVSMPLFRDVATYRGDEVMFFKRAQITAADLSAAFEGRGWGAFDDLDRLTIFADNVIPHVLRLDGVLSLEPALAASIDQDMLIPMGSEAEIELRACAVEAVEQIVAALRVRGHCATARDADDVLWNRGHHPHYKDSPRHRTRTVFY